MLKATHRFPKFLWKGERENERNATSREDELNNVKRIMNCRFTLCIMITSRVICTRFKKCRWRSYHYGCSISTNGREKSGYNRLGNSNSMNLSERQRWLNFRMGWWWKETMSYRMRLRWWWYTRYRMRSMMRERMIKNLSAWICSSMNECSTRFCRYL